MDFKFTSFPKVLLLWVSFSFAQNVNVVIHGATSIAKTHDNFVCATLDWWPAEKCDYNQCPWGKAGILNLDLSHGTLINAVKGNQLCGSGIGVRVDANQYEKDVIVLKNLVKELPQSGAWVSESGGAFNSGSKDESPTFVDGFCALLWHRLMGSTVLAVTKESNPDLRGYAHCAKKKPGVSVIFINLSKDRSFNINLLNLKSDNDGKPNYEFVGKQKREEYHLTSLFGKMKGGIVCLNDVQMVQPGSRDIPAMDPRLVDASAPIYVAAQSIAYDLSYGSLINAVKGEFYAHRIKFTRLRAGNSGSLQDNVVYKVGEVKSCPGNQLCGSGIGATVDANQYGKDVIVFKKLVKELYTDPETRPKVLGPGCFYDEKWLNTFLEDSGQGVVDGVTHHIYNVGPGDDPNLMSKILDPLYLSQVSQTYKGVLNVVNKFRPQSGAWFSESGGAFNSGTKICAIDHVTLNKYLDQMGMGATYDQKVFCMQALIDRNYGLLSATTFIPNPDYYGALLWHRLMGSFVLAGSKESDPDLSVYAHCAKKKPGVSVNFIKLSKDRSFNIILSNLKSEDNGKPNYEFVGKQNREEYHLTSLFGKMKGGIVCLNHVPMFQPGSRDIPAIDPRLVDASAPIYVVAQSIAYVTIRDFEVPACV
ncbi:hypothetical protein GQ457_01G017210 [Hibiscus cannabinus]